MELLNEMVHSDIGSFRIKQECPDLETDEISVDYHDDPDDPLPGLTMQDLIATIGKREKNDCISNSPDLYVCDICLRGYKSKYNLREHLRYECNQNAPLQCAHCPQRFKQPQNLKSHFFAVHPEEPWMHTDPSTNPVADTSLLFPSRFHCATCFRNYADKAGLKRHLESCGKLPPLKCDKCLYRTTRPGHLTRHIKNHHTQPVYGRCLHRIPRLGTCQPDVMMTEGPRDKHPCPDCPKSYQTREQLQRHADIECGKTPMQSGCKICATISKGPRKERKNQNSVQTVIKMEPVDISDPVTTDIPKEIIPSVTLDTKELLTSADKSTAQRRIELVERSTVFPCPKCHAFMKTQTSFENHRCPETNKLCLDFQCPNCRRFVKTRKGRMNHTCSKRIRVGLQCALCSITRHTKQDLGDHLRYKHPEVMESTSVKYVCHRCNKSFKSLENLKGHLRATCGKQKTIACPHADCTYMAKTKYHMNTHLKQSRKHTGYVIKQHEQKPWPCQVCDRSFLKKPELVKHVKYRCGVNPQFHCSNCKRIYRTKNDLNRHVTYECGKSPTFQCPNCTYCAKRRWSLMSHISKIHKEKMNDKN